MAATMSEAKFVSLRKRLDQLGYRQSLSLDSLPLVEKIFGDLLHTTDSLKAAKQELSTRNEQKVIWDQNVEPYKADNARLVRENNELHQRILREKETFEGQLRDLKAGLRKMEHENTDLKFLNTQYVQKLRSMEKDSQKKSEKILELQERNFQAVIHTPGGREKKIPFRRQRMDVDCLLPEEQGRGGRAGPPRPAPTDQYEADLLKVADDRIAEAQDLLGQKDGRLKELEENLQDLRRQVRLREEEIERLTEALSGGRPPEALQRLTPEGPQDRTVAHLNVQVDFLQEANRRLESSLQDQTARALDLQARVLELTGKNAAICSELRNIDSLAERVEEDKMAALDGKDGRIQELQRTNAQLRSTAEHLQAEVDRLTGERDALQAGRGEELERLGREVDRRDAHIQSLEQAERTEWLGSQKALLEENRKVRGEIEMLRNTIRDFDSELVEIQQNARDLAIERDNFRLLYEQVREELQHQRAASEPSSLQTSSRERRLLLERDAAVAELSQLKASCKSLQERLQVVEDTSQEEQRTLRAQLGAVKEQLEEVGSQNSFLTERIAAQRELVEKLDGELRASSAALGRAREEGKAHLAKNQQLQALLDGQERSRLHQRTAATSQAGELERQQAASRTQQRRIEELQSSEAGLRDEVHKLRRGMRELDGERDELVLSSQDRTQEVSALEGRLQALVAEREDALKRVENLQETISETGGRLSGKAQEVASLEGQLSRAELSLQALDQEKAGLEEERRQLNADLLMMTRENQALHQQIQDLQGERDTISERLRQYASSAQKMEETIAALEDERAGQLASLRALNDEKDRLEANLLAAMGDSSSVKFRLAALAQERDNLKLMVGHQAVELEQHLSTLNSYEVQLSSLSSALSKMDNVVRKEQEEKRALLQDVGATREVCAQLTQTKDSVLRELAAQQRENARLQMQFDNLATEKDYLTGEMAKRESTVHGLESVISQERTKVFLSEKELGAEREHVERLRTQVRRIEGGRDHLGAGLSQTRTEQYMTSLRSLQQRSAPDGPDSSPKDRSKEGRALTSSAHSLSIMTKSRDSLDEVRQREKDFMKREINKIRSDNKDET